jgi:hypothetical protein
MRKKCLAAAAIAVLSLQVTGCGAINLTTQERNVIAEYIANILLKHDKTYEPTLQYTTEEEVKEETKAKEETKEEKKTKTKKTAKTETTQTETDSTDAENTDSEESYVSLSSIYNSGLKVSSSGCSFYQTYPKNQKAVLPIEASSGNTICVVKLKVKNTTSSAKKINFIKNSASYRLEVNDGDTYSAEPSLLINDIQYLDVTLKSGGSYDAVVAFEVPKSAKKKSMNLLITKNSKTASMKIK